MQINLLSSPFKFSLSFFESSVFESSCFIPLPKDVAPAMIL